MQLLALVNLLKTNSHRDYMRKLKRTDQISMVLPGITVKDSTGSNSPYNTQYIRLNTSSATKTDTPIMETPFSVQSLPRQILQDQQAIRLDSVLQDVSGVTHITD